MPRNAKSVVILTLTVTGLIVSLAMWPVVAGGEQMSQSRKEPIPVTAARTPCPPVAPAPTCSPPERKGNLVAGIADEAWCVTSGVLTFPFKMVYHFFRDLRDVSCEP